jgi:hypothetical protein
LIGKKGLFEPIGVHLFMALYGLSVFLETPRNPKDPGRKTFLVISFVITGLAILTGALEASWSFRMIFEAAVPKDFYGLREKYDREWDRFLSMSSMTLSMVIGDGLLVRMSLPLSFYPMLIYVHLALMYCSFTDVI